MELFFALAVYLLGIIVFLAFFAGILMIVAPVTFIKLCIEFDTWWAKKRGWKIP
ncbi:hypothetical protein LCGC14_0763530 [marine sediment metagenome]|uniref:Uncharacterized protein n=1 Tax=marine sediment metagenome TaxID=412755 RepID=A0A0F9Q0M6_9ZZZZ